VLTGSDQTAGHKNETTLHGAVLYIYGFVCLLRLWVEEPGDCPGWDARSVSRGCDVGGLPLLLMEEQVKACQMNSGLHHGKLSEDFQSS
jgi:hypothetical protein